MIFIASLKNFLHSSDKKNSNSTFIEKMNIFDVLKHAIDFIRYNVVNLTIDKRIYDGYSLTGNKVTFLYKQRSNNNIILKQNRKLINKK